jgi:serine phosphatase RsbU (regulator of sigma subunit)
MDEKRQTFGESRIVDFLQNHAHLQTGEILQKLTQTIFNFSNSRQHDDATAIAVKIE